MTQGVYMIILDFIKSNQKLFADFCGDESIAWGNYNEFKAWLEDRDKSDAKILYNLKSKNEQLCKEANWLAEQLAYYTSLHECDLCTDPPNNIPEDGDCTECMRIKAREEIAKQSNAEAEKM